MAKKGDLPCADLFILQLTGARECVLIWWLSHWIFDLKKGYEAVRYFLSFPYTADIIKRVFASVFY